MFHAFAEKRLSAGLPASLTDYRVSLTVDPCVPPVCEALLVPILSALLTVLAALEGSGRVITIAQICSSLPTLSAWSRASSELWVLAQAPQCFVSYCRTVSPSGAVVFQAVPPTRAYPCFTATTEEFLESDYLLPGLIVADLKRFQKLSFSPSCCTLQVHCRGCWILGIYGLS